MREIKDIPGRRSNCIEADGGVDEGASLVGVEVIALAGRMDLGGCAGGHDGGKEELRESNFEMVYEVIVKAEEG